MVVYMLERRWEILQHYFEIHGNVRECLRKLRADFGRREPPSAPYDRYLIIFSDEAHFDLGGYVNKQNCRIWGTDNPHAYIEKPMHPKRITVWCGILTRSLSGYVERIFFHKN